MNHNNTFFAYVLRFSTDTLSSKTEIINETVFKYQEYVYKKDHESTKNSTFCSKQEKSYQPI